MLALKKFCTANLIFYYFPEDVTPLEMNKNLYLGNFVINVMAKYPAVIVRYADMFKNGELIGLVSLKIKTLKNVRVLKVTDWEMTKSNDYFIKTLGL
jgi:hypothetical protein